MNNSDVKHVYFNTERTRNDHRNKEPFKVNAGKALMKLVKSKSRGAVASTLISLDSTEDTEKVDGHHVYICLLYVWFIFNKRTSHF